MVIEKMASMNRVSLDTDVVFLRKVFAFDSSGNPAAPNTVLARTDAAATATGAGEVQAIPILDVLQSTMQRSYGKLNTELDGIHEDIEDLRGLIDATGDPASVAAIYEAIRDASNAYVQPLADLSGELNTRIDQITVDSFINNATVQLLFDLSNNVMRDLSNIHADISGIHMDISGLYGTTADISGSAADTRRLVFDVSGRLVLSTEDLQQQITDLSANVAFAYADLSQNMATIVTSVQAQIDEFYQSALDLSFNAPITFGSTATHNGQIIVNTAGTATAPAITFTNPDEDPEYNSATGIYHPADGEIAVSVNGVKRIGLKETGISLDVDGTATAPAISFGADTNTGIYHPAADEIAISAGGSRRMTVTSSNVTVATDMSVNGEVDVQGLGYTHTDHTYTYIVPDQVVFGSNLPVGPGSGARAFWPYGTYVENLSGLYPSNADTLLSNRVDPFRGGTKIKCIWRCPVGGLWQIALHMPDEVNIAEHIAIGNITRNQSICINTTSTIVFIETDDELLIAGNTANNGTLKGDVTGYKNKVNMTLIVPFSGTPILPFFTSFNP